MAEFEKVKSKLHTQDHLKSTTSLSNQLQSPLVHNSRITQTLNGEKLPSTYQEYEELLKHKETILTSLRTENANLQTDFKNLNQDFEYYKELSTTLESQMETSDKILKEAIEKLETSE